MHALGFQTLAFLAIWMVATRVNFDEGMARLVLDIC